MITDRQTFKKALRDLQPGDTVEVDRFSSAASGSKELISAVMKISDAGAVFTSRAEGVDTREGDFLKLCRSFYALDQNDRKEKQQAGIDKAKSEGKYTGRKPISVDIDLFDEVVAQWREGEITARAAMEKRNL